MKKKKNTMSVLVENKFGVLSRVSGLFSGRGYNIDSLTVTATQDPEVSKMTIVTHGSEDVLEQINKQLHKLIDVIAVVDLSFQNFVEREVLLIKVEVDKSNRADVIQIAEIFDGKIVSVNKGEIGFEITGRSDKIDDFIAMLKVENYKIIDLACSGIVAIARKAGAIARY